MHSEVSNQYYPRYKATDLSNRLPSLTRCTRSDCNQLKLWQVSEISLRHSKTQRRPIYSLVLGSIRSQDKELCFQCLKAARVSYPVMDLQA